MPQTDPIISRQKLAKTLLIWYVLSMSYLIRLFTLYRIKKPIGGSDQTEPAAAS